MRFLFRLGVLALAAVGAKALYDRFAPKAAELARPASDVLDTAKEAARGVTEPAKDAAAGRRRRQQRAGDVRDQAQDAAKAASSDDAPTVATSTTASTSTNSGH